MQQKKEENEEILFIGDPSQQIQIHKYDTETTLDNTQILQCVFTFVRKDSLYSKALKGILIRLLCEFKSENIKELFYSDNEKSKFHIYIQADSNTILSLADTLSSKLPLGLDFTFKDIIQLSIDEFNSIKSSDCVMIQTSKNLLESTMQTHAKNSAFLESQVRKSHSKGCESLESSHTDSISTNTHNSYIDNTQTKTLKYIKQSSEFP